MAEIRTVFVVCESRTSEFRSLVGTSDVAALMRSIFTRWSTVDVYAADNGTVDYDCQVAGAGMLDDRQPSWWSDRSEP